MLNKKMILGLLASAALSAPAHAASVSYLLTQSNALEDDVTYLQVTISDGVNGAIDFSVSALAPLTDIAGSNFGIQKFGFNVADGIDITADNITGLASSWKVANGNGQMSAFGAYDVVLQGTGQGRSDPLTFSVIGIDGDTVLDYVAQTGGNGSEGSSLFAAHVAGFDYRPGTSSAFFGGTTVVPGPGTAWLLLTGVAALGFRAVRRKIA